MSHRKQHELVCVHACAAAAPPLKLRSVPGLLLLLLLPTPAAAAGGSRPKAHTLQDSTDGFVAFLLVAGLPAAVYVATHWDVLLQMVHFWSVLLLVTGPLVFVTSLQGVCGSRIEVLKSSASPLLLAG